MLPALVGIEPVAAESGQSQPAPRGLFGASPDLELPDPSVPAAQTPAEDLPVEGDPASMSSPISIDDLPERGPEVVSRRDALTEVFSTADGREMVVVHNEPVHYHPEDSQAWEKIDSRLVADPARSGWVTNAANSWDVSFGPIVPGGFGGVEIVTDAGPVRFTPELAPGVLAAIVNPEVGTGDEADTVTYRNVWPGVDVVYEVTSTRVKEDIVVSETAFRSSFPFVVVGLDLSTAPADIVASTEETGAGPSEELVKALEEGEIPVAVVTGKQAADVRLEPVEVIDSEGRLTASDDAGTSVDVEPLEASEASTTSTSAPQAASGDAQRLVVDVNAGWLASETADGGEVVIDPTVSLGWYEMRSEKIDPIDGFEEYGCNSCPLRVGNSLDSARHAGGDAFWHTAMKFPYWGHIADSGTKSIQYAGIWLDEQSGYSANWEEPVFLWEACGMKFGPAVCDGEPTKLMDDAWPGATSGPGWPPDAAFDITEWLKLRQFFGQFPENALDRDRMFGFSGRDDQGATPDEYSLKQFDSIYMVMIINNRPPAPTLVSPTDGGLAVTTRTPTLDWDPVTDIDGEAVKYIAKISTSPEGDSGMIAQSGEITGTEWTVPDGILQDGVTYYWKVYAGDFNASNQNLSWVPSAVRKLTVDHTAGGMSPSDSFGGVTTNLVTGAPSFAVAGPQMPSVGGGVGVGFVYDAQADRSGLTATYLEDANQNMVVDASDPVKLVRTDSRVAFDWGDTSPGVGVAADHFMTHWSGFIRMPAGNWRFGVRTDDAAKLSINGTVLVDQNGANTNVVWQSAPALASDQLPRPIALDFFEWNGPAYMELWAQNTDNGQSFQVPADWFTPDKPTMASGWSLQAADANVSYTRAAVREGTVTLAGPDGANYAFTKQPDGSFKPPEGMDDQLLVNPDGRVTVHDDAGMTYVFRPDGGLESVASALDDRKPAAALNSFDNAGRLIEVKDPVSGRKVTFTYAATNIDLACPNVPPLGSASDFESKQGLLCKVTYWDTTETKLFYNKNTGTLANIANPGDLWWAFSYDSQGRLTGIADPLARDAIFSGARTDSDTNRFWTQIAYNGTTRSVASVTLPASLQTDTNRSSRTYAFAPVTTGGVLTSGTATLTRAGVSGTYRSVKYDHRGRLVESTDATGAKTISSWDGSDLATATETPDGLMTATVYNHRHQVTDVWGPAPKAWFNYVWFLGDYWFPKDEYKAQIPHTITNYDEGIDGLDSKWWNNTNLQGNPVLHQHNPGVVVESFPDASLPGVNPDNASARLTGDITFPAQGDYTMQLCVGAMETGKLYIGGIHVLSVNGPTNGSGPFACQGATYGANGLAGLTQPLRIDYTDAAGDPGAYPDELLHLNWTPPGGAYATVPASQLKPGYSLATSTTDADGKVTKTEYTDTAAGIGPQHGLPVRTITDPGGLNLTETTSYETVGTGYLRRIARTLPAGAATTTTNSYYAGDDPATPSTNEAEVRDNPCTVAADPAPQGGMVKIDTAADPDGAGSLTPIKRENVYDKSGRVVAYRAGSGTLGSSDWVCTTYDTRGRPTQIKYPAYGGQAARTVTSSYQVDPDGAGPRVASPMVNSTSDPAGTITTEVALTGEVISYKDVFANTTTFTYDLTGRETTNSGPVGTITKTYDNADRLTSLSRNSQVLAEGFVYDTSSRLRSVTYPTGAGKAGNGTTGTFDFEATYGRLSKVSWTGPGSTLITSDEVVARSLGGDVKDEKIDGVDHHTGADYMYDNAGRLTDAWVPGRHLTYQFAATGGCGTLTTAGANTNRTRQIIEGGATTNYCYDNADRLASATDATVGTIAYDTHGNTTSIFGETHAYDAADRHMSTVKGATTVTYVRDATDRIVERKLNGTTTARYGSTGSGDAPEFTTNASNVLQEVTYALPGGAMLTTRAAGNVWSYPNTHGDVVAVANQTGTKQGSTTNYDPYGNLITGTLPDNSTANLDYAWLGQPQRPLEHETALQPIIEMGARQYSPLLGRFAEVDPIEGGTTTNDYGYVPDPVNQFDLSGEGINQCDVLMLVSQGRGNGKNLTKKQKLSMFIRAQNCYKKTADGVKNRRGRVCKNGYFQSGIIVIGGFGGVLGKITAVSTGVVCKSDQEIRHWK